MTDLINQSETEVFVEQSPKEFIPVWLHVRLVSTLQLYSQMKANGFGRRAEFIAIKSSMASAMAAEIYVHQPERVENTQHTVQGVHGGSTLVQI